MKAFKNKNFTKRNYECKNIVFCKGEIAPNDNWIECDEMEIDLMGAGSLYIENNVRYFGFL
jgi:hypothetical protein